MSDTMKKVFVELFYQNVPYLNEAQEKFELIRTDQKVILKKLNDADWSFHIYDSLGRRVDTLNNLDSIRVTKRLHEIEAMETNEAELYLAFSEVTVNLITKIARFDEDQVHDYFLVK
jgi:hypothetical protein